MRRIIFGFLFMLFFLVSSLFSPDARAGEPVQLRREAEQVSENDIQTMLTKYNFFDRTKNTNGTFANDLVDNGDGTVTDRATGLMWQKEGSAEGVMWSRAKDYVNGLNHDRFAGYSDWRLPTIEELASLMKSARSKDLYVHPVFSDRQAYCWSADIHNTDIAWYVNFRAGIIMYSYHFFYYVRAVRSLHGASAE